MIISRNNVMFGLLDCLASSWSEIKSIREYKTQLTTAADEQKCFRIINYSEQPPTTAAPVTNGVCQLLNVNFKQLCVVLKVNGDMIFLQGGRLLQGGSNFISLRGRLRGLPGRFKGHFLAQITFFFVLLKIVIC